MKSNYIDIESINTQKPATENQIKNNKPSIIKNANVLDGYFANSINGGFIKPIAYSPIMAGTHAMAYKIRVNIGTLTPKTPNYQQIKAVLRTYFVPNSRVWKNAEKFQAQRANPTDQQIIEEPNIGGQKFMYIPTDEEDGTHVNIFDTDIFRDSWSSSYMPRYQTGITYQGDDPTDGTAYPKYSALPFRGFKAIYNDYERNKEYDEKMTEYDGDEVDIEETNTLIPYNSTYELDKLIVRGKRQNSYYTDYRTTLLGQDITTPNLDNGNNTLVDLVEYEKMIAELRAESENAQANDWDIIAKIHGSKKLTEGKVQLLGTREFPLNYQYVAQDTYNTNEQIEEAFQELGQLGAYCYTEINATMFQGIEFKEEGYLHTILQITSDSVFETGFERTGLNVRALDKYRPDLKELKQDVLYEIEKCGTRIKDETELTKITGFKRKFSEYFKLPNSISGDLATRGYYITEIDRNYGFKTSLQKQTNSKRTFQMFETDDKETGRFNPKNIWQDYTDINFNRNQATMQDVIVLTPEDNQVSKPMLYVKGDNQFYLMGMQTLIADLPIDENIKNNYKTWGEK